MQKPESSLPSSGELLRLAAESGWKVATLSKALGLSPRQLERRFSRDFGIPPHRWMDGHRSELASRRLMNREQAKFVASELGFASQSHFSRWFKHHNSQTATEFLVKAGARQGFQSDQSPSPEN